MAWSSCAVRRNAGTLVRRLNWQCRAMAQKAMLNARARVGLARWRPERRACVGNSALYTRCSASRPCAPLRALRLAPILSPATLSLCLCRARRDRRLPSPRRALPPSACDSMRPVSRVDCPCGLDRCMPPCAPCFRMRLGFAARGARRQRSCRLKCTTGLRQSGPAEDRTQDCRIATGPPQHASATQTGYRDLVRTKPPACHRLYTK